MIPNRGAWIELESDANGAVSVRIDRNRKMPATVLVRALGWSSNEDILDLFAQGMCTSRERWKRTRPTIRMKR